MAKHENRSYKSGDNLVGHIKKYENDRYLSMVSAVVTISCDLIIDTICITYTRLLGKARIKKVKTPKTKHIWILFRDVVTSG